MSFDIALSGLDATNVQLNTISNNIANVSTSGFKESRTEFSAVYNGMQAGGVEVAAISQNFDKTGSITGTGRPLDLAISGSGFFVTKDHTGQTLYTRSGVFGSDKDNNIVSNNGAKLQGYTVDANNNLQAGAVGNLKITTASLPAKATDELAFVANLDARSSVIDPAINPFDPNSTDSFNSSYTSKVYDSLGNPHTVTQYFTKTNANEWQVNVVVDGAATPSQTQNVVFNTDGTLQSPTAPFAVNFNPAGADAANINIDIAGTTQFGADFGVSTNAPNGYTSGELAGVRVEDNGMVFATYTNGQSQLQGQVMLADFANPQGLVKTNGTSWIQSFSSGAPVNGAPGTGTLGGLVAGALEGSNVDLTSELVSLMTAQRNYQANAKTISTSDKLTQSLFNAV
ncbi:flagellar hook protein FlgE [Photobacterium leiognathi]|uniref:Flagellar hook protein FlgE n=1 Tax=Photobacterium leiognathi subsp. mandapamensis TaxID=48408 RepID=A0A2T3KWL0_PHOLD|nr:flagellar hook protein FlgE [Photobacterium leiognathi]PSV04367.1 flagellar hook protein FlgE [Photobacterium leiognathi subsp. mandapamensis]PSV11757.1 flagellar hook protein FlgE [Photobacterium leiognathi subsp. mandapamensis]PSW42464.1 flagellar hook protein FlgE [Photobacterium leiognathi subsp. mandapamensis]PSW58474.1 flagellar hook protein FlgE [Photobacterium leiognathi subsp. mandapamensis]